MFTFLQENKGNCGLSGPHKVAGIWPTYVYLKKQEKHKSRGGPFWMDSGFPSGSCGLFRQTLPCLVWSTACVEK